MNEGSWEDYINDQDPYLCAWVGCQRGRYRGDPFCWWHGIVFSLDLWWAAFTLPFMFFWYLIFGIKIKSRKVDHE